MLLVIRGPELMLYVDKREPAPLYHQLADLHTIGLRIHFVLLCGHLRLQNLDLYTIVDLKRIEDEG